MKIDPARAKSLVSALHAVRERVAKAANGRNVSYGASAWPLLPRASLPIFSIFKRGEERRHGEENLADEGRYD